MGCLLLELSRSSLVSYLTFVVVKTSNVVWFAGEVHMVNSVGVSLTSHENLSISEIKLVMVY